jgi:hypothetical protein
VSDVGRARQDLREALQLVDDEGNTRGGFIASRFHTRPAVLRRLRDSVDLLLAHDIEVPDVALAIVLRR